MQVVVYLHSSLFNLFNNIKEWKGNIYYLE